MTCCFIGHRRIKHKKELASRLRDNICYLLEPVSYTHLDVYKRQNLNTLVGGGSGAGKTRFYCKPNLLQANTSFVILDPKGEIVRDVGDVYKRQGYQPGLHRNGSG